MKETTPHYFVEFLKDFNRVKENVIESRQELKEFKKETERSLIGISEQVALVTVRLWEVEDGVKNVRKDLKEVNSRLDIHFTRTTANTEKIGDVEKRVQVLEKHALA